MRGFSGAAFSKYCLALDASPGAVKGLEVSVSVYNLLDTKYFNTGIRDANGGETAGTWNGRTWTGSGGYYNSKLPQPRRFVLFSLMLEI